MNNNYDSKQVKAFSKDELNKGYSLLKKMFFNLRFQKSLGDLKDTSKLSKVRKSIARIKTEITYRFKKGGK